MLKHQGMAIACAILFTFLSTASQAEFRRSLIQKAENNIYIALGGGGGGMNTGNWDVVAPESLIFPATGVNQPNNKTVGTANGMAAIGYGFDEIPFRLEFAYNFIGDGEFRWDNLIVDEDESGLDLDAKSKIFSNTFMINGYLDFVMNDNWLPYIMVGAGYGINSGELEYTVKEDGVDEFTETSHRKNKGNFVFNAGVGLNYALSEDWSVGVSALYFYLGKAEVDAFDFDTQEDVSLFSISRLDAFIAQANLAYHF